MGKLAELQGAQREERKLWELVIAYANGEGETETSRAKDFKALVGAGFNWLGGDGRLGGRHDSDISRDARDGTSLDTLAERYRSDFRLMLGWIVAPDVWLSVSEDEEISFQAFAANAGGFLSRHATAIRMSVNANTEFDPNAFDEQGRMLVAMWPEECGSVISPVCKFILDQIILHDKGGETLRKVIPIGHCERPGCGRFYLIERIGRGRFCSDSCRVKFNTSKMTKEQSRTKMAKYRASLKEMASKPLRIAKKKPVLKARAK
jgi:hypothetical protein